MLVEPIGQVHEQQEAVVLRMPAESGVAAADRTEVELAERERVARALCDTVLHDLFAIGLSLQGIAMRADGDVRDRLHRVVSDFDEVITGLRRAVFPVAAAVVAAAATEGPGEREAEVAGTAGPTALTRSGPVQSA